MNNNYKLDQGISEWDIVMPEAVGVTSKAVIDFLDELDYEDLCMHGFVMVKDRKVFSEGYYTPFHEGFQHRMYSVSKSFTSVAIGLLIEEGKLSLDDKIYDYFSDKLTGEEVHPYIKLTTIRDMLCMATAHKSTTYNQVKSDDWVKTFFTVSPVRYPGTSFVYDTSSTHVLSALVEKLSNMSLFEYLKSKVLNEIGFSRNSKWLTCPMGICRGGGGLICTLRDLVKFAYVCMNDGQYGGRQLIPRDFIRAATKKQIDTSLRTVIEEQQGYGYKFWRCRNNGFMLYGLGGQMAVCLPDFNFIFAVVGFNHASPANVQSIFSALWHNILPILKKKHQDMIAEEPETIQKLADRIARLKVKSVEGVMVSEIIPFISGNTYSFPSNFMGLKECSFRFNLGEEKGTFSFTKEKGTYEISFGMGNMEVCKFPETDFNCNTSAAWVETNKLYMRTYVLDDCFADIKMTATFIEDKITIAMKKTSESMMFEQYQGLVSGILKQPSSFKDKFEI